MRHRPEPLPATVYTANFTFAIRSSPTRAQSHSQLFLPVAAANVRSEEASDRAASPCVAFPSEEARGIDRVDRAPLVAMGRPVAGFLGLASKYLLTKMLLARLIIEHYLILWQAGEERTREGKKICTL